MIKKNENPISSDKGSAIIWILIAVGLFAALAFAFQSSNRTSTSMLSDEEAQAYAHQIIQYGNEVKAAVKRLQLRGCDDTEISFENSTYLLVNGSTYPGNGANPNSPSDGTCHVFDTKGGQITPQIANGSVDQSLLDSCGGCSRSGHYTLLDMAVEGVGTAEEDLILFGATIDRTVCKKINTILGVDNPADNPPDIESISDHFDDGTYDSPANETIGVLESTAIQDKTVFCAARQLSGPLGPVYQHFHQVLIVR